MNLPHSNNMPENTEKRSSRLEKALNLLEFDRIKDAVAACALSAEAARGIREENPLFDPEQVRVRKKLVSSFCELITNTEGENGRKFPRQVFYCRILP
jgi:dsDNA-specific endonuclease/ATPase MutS2